VAIRFGNRGPTLAECRTLCDDSCEVYSYDTVERNCALYGAAAGASLSFENKDSVTSPRDCDSTTLWLKQFAALQPNDNDDDDTLVSLYQNNKDDTTFWDAAANTVFTQLQSPETDFIMEFVMDADGACDVCPEGEVWELETNRTYCKFGTPDCSRPCPNARDGFLFWGTGLLTCPQAAEWFHGEGCCTRKRNDVVDVDVVVKKEYTEPCWIPNYDYGSSCRDTHVFRVVSASRDVLHWGNVHGWWNMFTTTALLDETMTSPLQCLLACELLADNNDNTTTTTTCQGWEWHSNELCVLLQFAIDSDTTSSSDDCRLVRSEEEHIVSGIPGCLNVTTTHLVDTSDWTFSPDPSTCTEEQKQPRCTSPPSNGTWNLDTFLPDDDCVLKTFLPDQLYSDCLPNRWIVLNGGSNVLIFYMQLVNLLAPLQNYGLDPLVDWRDVYSENIIDIVIRKPPLRFKRSDDLLYRKDVEFCELGNRTLPCEGTSLDFQGDRVDWDPEAYGAVLDEVLRQAPYEEDAVRITLITGQVWSNARVVLEALGRYDNNAWKDNLVVYMQSMIWYPCRVEGWCELEELGSTHADMMDKYTSDVDGLMAVAETVCESMHCVFATHGYEGGHAELGRSARYMVQYLQRSVPDNSYLVDWNGFATEVLDGHVTPAMMSLAQQMIWNSVCPVEDELLCPTVVAMSPSCHANCLELTGHDREYYEDNEDAQCGSCPEGGWICMGHLQCRLQIATNVPYEVLMTPKRKAADQLAPNQICLPPDWLSPNVPPVVYAQLAAAFNTNNNDDCKKRLWCGTAAQGWLVGLLVFFLGVGLLVLSQWRQRRQIQEKKKLEENFTIVDATIMTTPSKNKQSSSNMPDTPQTMAETPPTQSNRSNNSRPTSPYLEEDEEGSSAGENGQFSDEDTVQFSNSPAMISPTTKKPRPVMSPLDQRKFVFDKDDNDDEPHDLTPADQEVSVHRGVLDEEDPIITTPAPVVKPPAKEYLHSLGFARLLASQHIVLGHLFAKGAIANVYLFGWGYTWVPWFFVLSGYVLTHARLNSTSSNDASIGVLSHIAKRLSSIFPMYAFGVIITMLIRVGKSSQLPSWGVLWGQSYLLQSWNPLWTEHALVSQCWFLSNLLLYWGLFSLLLKHTRRVSLTVGFGCLVLVSLLPWLLVLVPALDPGIEHTWYSDHTWGKTDTATDVWTVLLKFHPLCYLHVFWYGMLLAVVRHRVKEDGGGGTIASLVTCLSNVCGASCGYLGLVLMFTIPALQPAGYKLSARLSVLLPLQGMVLWGLSPIAGKQGQDPLAWVFAKLSPSWVGDASYCQYVLQFAMYELFPQSYISNPSFFLYLWGASLVAFQCVHRPLGNVWRKQLVSSSRRKWLGIGLVLLVPTTGLAIVLSIAKGVYTPTNNKYSSSSLESSFNASNATLPPFVQVAPEVVDVALNWTLAASDDTTNLVLINPSLLLVETEDGGLELIRAARAHNVTTTYETDPATNKTTQTLHFSSHLAMSRTPVVGDDFMAAPEPLQLVDVLAHRGRQEYWQDSLCDPDPQELDPFLELQKHVTGPEDPKLVARGDDGSWGIAFSSLVPRSLLQRQRQCHMQMFYVSDGPTTVKETSELWYDDDEEAQGVHLNCNNDNDERRGDEKNWIGFTYGTNDQLYFVQSIQPHVVVQVRPKDGYCRFQYETSTEALLASPQLRGSATAVRYGENEYLAAFHTPPPYRTVLYTFEARPPFRILRIARKPLPLVGEAFVSSLQVVHNADDRVWIGYGHADASSRLLVLSRDVVEKEYFGASCGGDDDDEPIPVEGNTTENATMDSPPPSEMASEKPSVESEKAAKAAQADSSGASFSTFGATQTMLLCLAASVLLLSLSL